MFQCFNIPVKTAPDGTVIVDHPLAARSVEETERPAITTREGDLEEIENPKKKSSKLPTLEDKIKMAEKIVDDDQASEGSNKQNM